MAAWNNSETAHSQTAFSYNPWATTKPGPGSHGGGTQGNIQIYPTYDVGVTASAATIAQKNMAPIVAALKNPNTTQASFAQAVGQSYWNRGKGGRINTSYVHLVATASQNLTGGNGAGGTPPRVSAGPAAPTGNVSAAGPAGLGNAATATCAYEISFPFPGSSSDVRICADKLVGGLAMTGGALLMLAGVAIVAAAVLQKTGAGTAAGQAAGIAATAVPVGRVATAAKAAGPAARAARRQTAAAAEVKRTAPVRAAERSDELHQARLRRAERTAATRAGTAPRRVSSRPSSDDNYGGRSTASILAANKRRADARDRAAASGEGPPW